jgi:hypothetical protein
MKYWTRVSGSQRASSTQQATFGLNFSGQGGDNKLVIKIENNKFLIFEPETIEEIRELQSQAAILAHNFRNGKK